MVTYHLSAQSPIGIFDSGIGGTTVLRKLTQSLPNEKIVYFGDTARLPYGNKTPAQILHYSTAILHWMAARGVKMVLIGCNTSSALAYAHLSSFAFPIFDIIRPLAESESLALFSSGEAKTLGVFATAATVKSDMHKKIIQAQLPHLNVVSIACPEWVPIIENGHIEQPETLFHLKKYVEPILEQGVDALVYGCTHYPLLENKLKEVLPAYLSHIPLIDPADLLVEKAIQYLVTHQLLNQDAKQVGSTRFHVTGDTQLFSHHLDKIWGHQAEVTPVCLDFKLGQINAQL
jgi:glutamate racemase